MSSNAEKDAKDSLSIEFLNSPQGYYVAGSTVIGKVIVTLSKARKARNVTIHAFGSAKTSFYDESLNNNSNNNLNNNFNNNLDNNSNNKNKRKMVAEKIFLKLSTTLWSAPNQDVKEVPAGTKTFKFSFEIPINCLPSFDCGNGKVKYSIKAEMDMHLGFNLKTEKKMQILTIMHPSIACNPVNTIYSHKVDKEKFIVFTISLDKEHYVCGENVLLSIDIKNETKVVIDSVETGLTTKVIYIGRSTKAPHYIASSGDKFNTLSLVEKVTIKSGQSHVYKRNIKLSKFFPTISDEILDVKHFVYFKFHKKSRIFSTVTETYPITLYTAKLGDSSEDTVPHNVQDVQIISEIDGESVPKDKRANSKPGNSAPKINQQMFSQFSVSGEETFETKL